MPTEDVDEIEDRKSEFIQTAIDDWTEEIFARLRKRYDTAAMAQDPPRTVLRWLVKLVTRDCYDFRGNNPASESDKDAIYGAAERAELELKEAADAVDGLFELPLLGTTPADGAISRGSPLGYSETSPYVWTDVQRLNGRSQDRNGSGG